MYNLEKVQEEILKEMTNEPLVSSANAELVYKLYKQYVIENKVEYFHKAIKKKIMMNERDNLYDYVYYIFNEILDKYKIKEESIWH